MFDGVPALDWTVEVALPKVAGMEATFGATPDGTFVDVGCSDKPNEGACCVVVGVENEKVGGLDVVLGAATPGNEVGVPPNEKFMMLRE